MTALPRNLSGVPIVWRDRPFSGQPHFHIARDGQTIADIVEEVCDELPVGFDRFGQAFINGQEVPRKFWHLARPRYRPGVEIIVSLGIDLRGPSGGSGGSGKNTLATVATIAVLVAAVVVSAGAFGTFGAVGIGTLTWAQVAGAGIALGGSLAIAALTPPPSFGAIAGLPGGPGASSDPQGGASSLSGNLLAPGGPIPLVCGTKIVYPPLAHKALIDLDGDDEVVEGTFVLSGRHQLDEIRIDGTLASDIDEVEIETREGAAGDTATTLVTRYSRTDTPGIQLSAHEVNPDATTDLLDQTTPTNSIPKWHSVHARKGADEVWLNLQAPEGLMDADFPNVAQGFALRLRFRLEGSATWNNCPEIHFIHHKNVPFQKLIKFKWLTTAPAQVQPGDTECFWAAYSRVPMRVSRVYGNMTVAGGLKAAFNGDVVQGAANCAKASAATTCYVGADFSGTPRVVKRFVVFPHIGSGFISSANAFTVKIYGKTTLPASGTDGTLLATASLSADQTTPVTFDTSNTTAYSFYHVLFTDTVSNSDFLCAGFHLYEETSGSTERGWQAHSSFAGSDAATNYLDSSNYNPSAPVGVGRINLYADRVEFYLNPATFPKGKYEIQVKRSMPYPAADFTTRMYRGKMTGEPAGPWVPDLFYWNYVTGGPPTYLVGDGLKGYYHKLAIPRMMQVVNTHPIQTAGLSIIQIKARKRAIGRVSVLASRYVNRWNGTNWTSSNGISSNPADHYRDVLAGALNANALPTDLLDDDSLVDGWQHADDNNYQVNAVIEGRSAYDVMNLLGGCMYARPRQSEKWGLMLDRDTSGESVVDVFADRNMRSAQWAKGFQRQPTGFRVRFDDIDQDYEEREIIVLRPGATDDGRYEDIRYDGLVTEAEAVARAEFDLLQPVLRGVSYSIETNLQHLRCERGDLVGLNTDIIDGNHGSGLINSITTSGANITGLVIDGSINISGAGPYGVSIRCKDGSVLIKQITASIDTAKTITFSTPFANPGTTVIDIDCLVTAGLLGSVFRRVRLSRVAPGKGLTGALTFVDEAPSLPYPSF